MRHRRALTSVAAALIVVALGAGPVAAAKPGTESFSFSSTGLTAETFESSCTDNTDGTVSCSGSGVFVFVGRSHERGSGAVRASDVCYSQFTSTFNPATGEEISFAFVSGCATGSVEADNLSSVTVGPTTITTMGESCTASGEEFECVPIAENDVAVAGTFTGVGATVRESFRSFFDDGVCVVRESSSGSSRGATFSGSVDGQPIETEDAFLRDGRFSFRSTCSIE